MNRALLIAIIPALLLLQGAPTVAQTPDALSFFKNYFITGDYTVGGVGLRNLGVNGIATGSIPVTGVPASADVLAAFLYWQVVTKGSAGADAGNVGVTFRGYPLSAAGTEPFGKVLGTGTPPCWSSGGGTGPSNGTNQTYTYRADVLRYFDVDAQTGKFTVNGAHQVQLPDGGEALALGASLVVIYRDPALPLSAIVLYDGAYTMDQSTESMVQRIGGFYDAGESAKLTHIVGSGQANKSEILRFNGTALATNPFSAVQGSNWDNPTYQLTPAAFPNLPNLAQVTTSVDHQGFSSFDCLTWAAIVYRTAVKDRDGDGLLDLWESSETPILDPYGQALPNLKAMGADPDHKDVFIELGFMFTEDDPDPAIGPPSYGGVPKPAHSHSPSPAALKMMGDAFANAPVANPDGRTGIALHIDAGSAYPTGEADPYLIRGDGLARGGEAINELATVCTRGETDPPGVCQFSGYPGTVGWKTGFRFLRDEVLSGPEVPPGADDPCDQPGSTCVRRFDRNRNDTFHYALFAHAIGLPKSMLPCLDEAGSEVPTNIATERCDAPLRDNPAFHIPRTNTGVADFPGGDILVTLGAFPDTDGKPVGTPFMQAGTFMHEWGHNAELTHGGQAGDPNCKPVYASVMNYLYQLRGLLDDAGRPHLDFSRSVLAPAPDEQSLADGQGSMPYRLGWYAPLFGSYLEGRATAAAKHCDGGGLTTADVPMVRIDARTAGGPIDWNANGSVSDIGYTQDINFNGRTTASPTGTSAEILRGFDDWANLRLNQVGARRNVGGPFFDREGHQVLGPLSISMGRWDFGRWDFASSDLGRWDFGVGDASRGDLGQGDYGRWDFGRWDFGRWDFGRWDFGQPESGRGDEARGYLGGGDMFVNDPNNPGGELDFETAADLAKTPPNEFTACVIGVDCVGLVSPNHRVRVSWTPTNVGGVGQYAVYRVQGDSLLPGQPWTLVATVAAVSGQQAYALVDTTQLLNGVPYTFFAVALYGDTIQSDPSNLVTVLGVNDPPVARNDSYTTAEDTLLIQATPGVLGNDSDSDTDSVLTAALVTSPAHGTLALSANGSFTYTPAANYHGPDSFTYKANDGAIDTNVATVSITVASVNDAPTISNLADRTIDGNTSTGALSFTIGDDDLSTVALSASSSNTTLVPTANIVFGGTGAARTVTVTPTSDQNGTATITLRVTDSGGLMASDSFVLTVRQVNYTLVGVQNVPPVQAAKAFKAGSAVPMKWQFKSGATVVSSPQVAHAVTVRGPLPSGPIRDITNTDPGSSSFRYDAPTKTWQFNLQTKEPNGQNYPIGLYEVTITPTTPGFLPSPVFQIQLVK